MIIRVIFAFLAAVVIACLTLTLSNMFGEVTKSIQLKHKIIFVKEIKIPNLVAVIRAAIVGIFYLSARLLIPRLPIFFAAVLILLTLFFAGYLTAWFFKEGSSIKEILMFVVIQFFVARMGKMAAIRLTDIDAPVGVAILNALPWIWFLMSVGLSIADAIWFRMKLDAAENVALMAIKEERGDENEAECGADDCRDAEGYFEEGYDNAETA